MDQISKKMEVLMDLGIPSIVKINSTTAMMKLPRSWECMIDISARTDEWIVKSKDAAYDWQTSPMVPDDIRDEIWKVSKMYNETLLDSVEWRE